MAEHSVVGFANTNAFQDGSPAAERPARMNGKPETVPRKLMPDKRKHRGPHPGDSQRFGVAALPALQRGTSDLSWLLTHGYAINSSLKLVGDRYALDSRQRLAIGRCACGDHQRAARRATERKKDALAGLELWIDGFNVLTTVEAALSGAPIFHARDDAFRDMASMHGSYRKVTETRVAIDLIGDLVETQKVRRCHWLLDRPVSNSGKLKGILNEAARAHGWDWTVDLVDDPDPVLKANAHVVATADGAILDSVQSWFNLARIVVERRIPTAWLVDLSTDTMTR